VALGEGSHLKRFAVVAILVLAAVEPPSAFRAGRIIENGEGLELTGTQRAQQKPAEGTFS